MDTGSPSTTKGRHRRSPGLSATEIAGLFIASTAAAVMFGAGAAHADDGSGPPSKGSDSSASSPKSPASGHDDKPGKADKPDKVTGDGPAKGRSGSAPFNAAKDRTPALPHAGRTSADSADGAPGDGDTGRGRIERSSPSAGSDKEPANGDSSPSSKSTVVTIPSIFGTNQRPRQQVSAGPASSEGGSTPCPSTSTDTTETVETPTTMKDSTSAAPTEPSTPSTPDPEDSGAGDAAVFSLRGTKTTPSAVVKTAAVVTPNASVAAVPAPQATVAQVDPFQSAEQFVRQIIGLNVDLAAIGASLINNIATQVAMSTDPQFFGGIPYSFAIGVATVSGDVSKLLTGAPLNATSTGPFPVNYGVFNVLGLFSPQATPPGANDPSITVTAAHPLPIILINGTTENEAFNWSVGAPVLANAGYKVYTFSYGNDGTADITQSAQELSTEIDTVLAETGAPQVILVGHSQGGGILPEYYLNVMAGASKVSQLIGISPTNHGTDLDYLAYGLSVPIIGTLIAGLLNAVAPSLVQQTINSPLNQLVYGNGDTQPGVLYTTIVSMNDEIVTPYTQQFLSGPNVTNILVQDQDPGFIGGHISMVVNPTVWSDVLDSLSANPAANPQVPSMTSVA